MGTPAAVMGDQIVATCSTHLIPNPASGAPQPAPPLPFSAPVLQGAVGTVLIGGQPAVVVGASGLCTPPHVGLHPSDPYCLPMAQLGQVVGGSSGVLIASQPAANATSSCTVCDGMPGALQASGTTVLIG